MTALLALVAVAGWQNREKLAAMFETVGRDERSDTTRPDPDRDRRDDDGETAGGLGDLIERFRRAGQAETADSWVGTGANREVGPSDLERALGPDVLDKVVAQSGLSRQEVLERLSRDLPDAVDRWTPDGKLPGEERHGGS
jgi:uncharacterized protein YidB (DUF937 family)